MYKINDKKAIRRTKMCIKMLHHVCIQTDKYKESLDFYTNVLGFKVIRERVKISILEIIILG